jgi:ribosomal protein L11 methyltransferase
LQVVCSPQWAEILMAEVAEAGFDTFMETDKGFEAYAEQNRFDVARLESIREKYQEQASAVFFQDRVKKENWNELWEKNYEPVVVEDQCLIRASFHRPEKKYPYEIVITPKMSFGTGHHATTYLMLKNQMKISHAGLRVMDAGTGTGILAIMADKRGAAFVDAFDTDDWSIENSTENIQLNQSTNVRIRKGTVSTLFFEEPFDLILANINKNVLVEEMPKYAAQLKPAGLLLISGFYVADVPDLEKVAQFHGLIRQSTDERDNWACVLFVKR